VRDVTLTQEQIDDYVVRARLTKELLADEVELDWTDMVLALAADLAALRKEYEFVGGINKALMPYQDRAVRAEERAAKLEAALTEYASHQAWRCDYRSRYGSCRCGLDETLKELGMEPVPVYDPEAT
jgi:hypothetical protein